MSVSRPYGLWDSPLQACDLTSATRLRDVAWDSDGRTLVWLEGRGSEGVVVCQSEEGGAPRDLTTGFNVRARVGYGGGDFTVSGGCLYFTAAGERLYARDLAGGAARPLTPVFGRPAAPTVSRDGRWVVYVHNYEEVDRLAVVDTGGRHWPQWLVEGADFYMQPTWHPRGRQLAWIEWNHPQMPWDGTRLMLGDVRLRAGSLPRLEEAQLVAGGAEEAIMQPSFSPDGRYLAYVSDRRGWSDVWLYDLQSGAHRCLAEADGDVGAPAWVQGIRVYGFSADSAHIYFTRTSGAHRRAYGCAIEDGTATAVAELAQYSSVAQIAPRPRGSGFACIASSGGLTPRVLSTRSGKPRVDVRARATGETTPAAAFSVPEPVSWRAANGDAVHGLYYPPVGDFEAPGLPPLMIDVHGGPTSQAEACFEPEVQYFATRGYAIVSVNYRGSTGYGRDYMKALRGSWGVYDLEDAIGAATHLADRSLVDAERLIITGGSAGGYTVLRALTERPGFFRAGICRYGISNLFSLAADTHKFESRYNDSLLGALPQAAGVYRERSPLFKAGNISDPVAIFQGVDDDIVAKSQSDAIVESLARRGIPHIYHLYEGEGHGFRKPETIRHYITAVEAFLKEHVLFG